MIDALVMRVRYLIRGEMTRAPRKNKQSRLELVKPDAPVRTLPAQRTIDCLGM